MYSLARATTAKYSALVMLDSIGTPVGRSAGASALGGAGRSSAATASSSRSLAAGISGACASTLCIGPDRRDHDDLVLHAVEDGGDGGAQQDGVGQAQRVGRRIGQILDLPHHVIAQIAEQARRHGRQAGRQVHARLARSGRAGIPAAWLLSGTNAVGVGRAVRLISACAVRGSARSGPASGR